MGEKDKKKENLLSSEQNKAVNRSDNSLNKKDESFPEVENNAGESPGSVSDPINRDNESGSSGSKRKSLWRGEHKSGGLFDDEDEVL